MVDMEDLEDGEREPGFCESAGKSVGAGLGLRSLFEENCVSCEEGWDDAVD
jgi:hypothetical protein